MLVLGRNCDEVIRIGPQVKVKVLSIQRRRVKLGIDAPTDIQVWREEIVSNLERQGLNPEEELGASASIGTITPFVVEDDPAHARLICEALLEQRLACSEVVSTGAAALAALGIAPQVDEAVNCPRLVLLDLHLPDMFGLDVLRAIRSTDRLRTTPVVILSAVDDEGVIVDCLEAGANAFVTKSTEYTQLRRSVSRIAAFWGFDCRVPKRSAKGNTKPALARPK